MCSTSTASSDKKAHHQDERNQTLDSDGSYWNLYLLLRTNRSFCLYLLSDSITMFGEWFTYVASITMIKQILQEQAANGHEAAADSDDTNYGKALSFLVVLKMIPQVCLSAVGGTLADSYDRRVSMIYLNIVGGTVALVFCAAYACHSIVILYIMVAIQQSLAAILGPCGAAILPQICSPEEIKHATLLKGAQYSIVVAVGASCGGFFVAHAGIPLCFVVDSMSFFLSAAVMYLVPGEFLATSTSSSSGASTTTEGLLSSAAGVEDGYHDDKKQSSRYKSIPDQIWQMSCEVSQYLRSSAFGAVIFFKATATFLLGASTVLNVPLSEQPAADIIDATTTTTTTSSIETMTTEQRLGVLYGAVGVGCILGPVCHDLMLGGALTPNQMQRTCVVGLWLISVSYFGIWLWSDQFSMVLSCCVLRSMGGALVFVQSTVLVQRFTSQHIMGRVLAVETASYLSAESGSAVLVGYLLDSTWLGSSSSSSIVEGSAKQQQSLARSGSVSLVVTVMGVMLTMVWTVWHLAGYGMAVTENKTGALHGTMKRKSSATTDTGEVTNSDEESFAAGAEPVESTIVWKEGTHLRTMTKAGRMDP